jgi:hypothetical protein
MNYQYHPVLPAKNKDKLIFPLCGLYSKTKQNTCTDTYLISKNYQRNLCIDNESKTTYSFKKLK